MRSYFKNVWYSNEAGIRKPCPEAFIKLLKEENLKAQETLFVDDTIGNIEGAKKAGLHVIHLHPPKTILDLHL